MTDTQQTQTALQLAQKRAHDFNADNPPGTPVFAYPGTLDDPPIRTRIRYSAWVIGGDLDPSPMVSVHGYAGGIHLDHIKPDPERQPAIPDLTFESPPCPICHSVTDTDGDAFVCHPCGASWGPDGSGGRWDNPDAARCPAKRAWALSDGGELPASECALERDHHGDRHRDRDGFDWHDADRQALIDSEGEPIQR